MSFAAFFDTNVLYGARLNDLILWLADGGAFRPLWSADVMEELRRNLLDNGEHPELVAKRLAAMTTYFPDAIVDGYKNLIDGMSCHPKDRHVLAAAVRANAQVLVTFDIKDFPAKSTKDYEVEVVHPDDFLLDQLDLYPGMTIATLDQLVATYDSPAMTIDELLQSLARAGVPKFAQEVLHHF